MAEYDVDDEAAILVGTGATVVRVEVRRPLPGVPRSRRMASGPAEVGVEVRAEAAAEDVDEVLGAVGVDRLLPT